MPTFLRRSPFLLLFALAIAATAVRGAEPNIQTLEAPSGVRFGVLGEKPAAPAPTLLVFAGGFTDTLANPEFAEVGNLVARQGFLCVSVDVPCHGEDVLSGEPSGLDGWRYRLERGDDLVTAFAAKVSAALDYLIAEGYTDPERISACGTSRGGFIALHLAAAEPRVKQVIAFAPVTDLPVVREFNALKDHELTNSLKLARHADRLADRGIWLCIGNNDERVDTDEAIAFTRAVVKAAAAAGRTADVELHVMTSPGHTIHKTAHPEAAAWLLAHVPAGNAR